MSISSRHLLTAALSRPFAAASLGVLPRSFLSQPVAINSNVTCGVQSSSRWFSSLLLPFTPAQVSRSTMASSVRTMTSLFRMHKTGPHFKVRKPRRPLDGNPFLKGVVLKTLIKKPKKPNSANRRCVLVRLSNGKEAVAHVPGEGHNLQEHNMVLVRCGRLQDVPAVRLKVVRGKYDCGLVIKKTQTNS